MKQHHIQPTVWDRNKTLLKGLLIGLLILLMLIPQAFVSSLVTERQMRQQDVLKDINDKWAGGQTVIGPVLVLPYHTHQDLANGKHSEFKHLLYVMPDQLQVTGDIQPEQRHRSLFKVTLYTASIQLQGRIDSLPLANLNIKPEDVLWDQAFLVMNVDDVKGLQDNLVLDWNGAKHSMQAYMPANQLFHKGFSAPVAVSNSGPFSFSLNVSLRGADYLYIVPVGRTTNVALHANWKDPAFDGQYLPTQTPEVSDKGFTAKWKILPVSQSNPQYVIDSAVDLRSNAFGVKLIQPVDNYSKTDRTIKYAILFIALTFTFFFFLEMLQRHRVHPLQYLLIGFALIIFYTLLLSISEYTGFNKAYVISAVATVILIGCYVWSIFKNIRTTSLFTISLTGLYTYIFVLIQLQDYALLFGSIGLFFIMAIIMFYSRKIDWYSITTHTPKSIAHEEPLASDVQEE